MSFVQRLFKGILPRSWGDAMEASSRAWTVRCPNCSHERSVWEMGGIRWGASGNPQRRLTCPGCGATGWHKVFKP